MEPLPLAELLKSPIPKPKVVAGLRPAVKGKALEQLQRQLWSAIEKQDPEQVRAALNSGADPLLTEPGVRIHPRQYHRAALHKALANNDLASAQVIQEAGGRPTPECWYEVSNHDSVAIAKQLDAWKVPFPVERYQQPKHPMEYFEREETVHALAWAIQRWGVSDKAARPNETYVGPRLVALLLAARIGGPEVAQQINAHWKLDPTEPMALAQASSLGTHAAREAWRTVVAHDDVTAGHVFMGSGWAPPDPVRTMWSMVEQSAWGLLAWFRSVPAIDAAFQQAGQAHPERTWWRGGNSNGKWVSSPSALEQYKALGFNPAWPDEDGNLLIHRLSESTGLIREKRWWVRHHPELVIQPNHKGEAASDRLSPELKRELDAALLKQTLAEAPTASVSRRPRM